MTRYIGMDLSDGRYARFGPFDLTWDGDKIPLDDRSVDCAIAIEVLIQCPYPERVLFEIARVLNPGGRVVVASSFLWPIHDPPCDEQRLTPYALERQLRNAGFTAVERRTFGGWDASLAQMLALWVRRRPMRRVMRLAVTALAMPIVSLLEVLDRVPQDLDAFANSNTAMITGAAVAATKSR